MRKWATDVGSPVNMCNQQLLGSAYFDADKQSKWIKRFKFNDAPDLIPPTGWSTAIDVPENTNLQKSYVNL